MHSIKPTPKMVDGLRWFRKHEPIGWFDASAPSRIIRKRLQTAGWIMPVEPLGRIGVIQYRVTETGVDILEHH